MNWDIFYVIGGLLSIIWNTGISFSYHQHSHYSPAYAEKDVRDDLGFSLLMSVLLCPFWPIAVFVFFCLSGFYKHGWFRKGY